MLDAAISLAHGLVERRRRMYDGGRGFASAPDLEDRRIPAWRTLCRSG